MCAEEDRSCLIGWKCDGYSFKASQIVIYIEYLEKSETDLGSTTPNYRTDAK